MDWKSTVIGAIIGFISSVGIIFVERLMDHLGKVKIFAKIVFEHQFGMNTWGFQKTADGLFLNVPIWLELQNLSNTGRVMRDVNLVLYKNGVRVTEMTQINHSGKRENLFVYANHGSYSFALDPRSITKYECHFALKMDTTNPQHFDQIKLRYYDEADKEHLFIVGNVNGNWTLGDFDRPEAWFELNENSNPALKGAFVMKEGKIEYLQMLQEPISRMSTASAIFKGFAATIVAGIAALSYCEVNIWVLGLSFVPVILFAFLDIYYLKLEKKYRYLYEQVRTDAHEVDFSMKLTKDNKAAKARVWDCIQSPSIWLFYPAMIAILGTVMYFRWKGII